MLFDGRKLVDRSFVTAVYLVANPGVVVREFERGAYTYYCYDNGKFYACRPANRKQKGWHEARGLKQWFDKGMHDLFVPDDDDDDKGVLPF